MLVRQSSVVHQRQAGNRLACRKQATADEAIEFELGRRGLDAGRRFLLGESRSLTTPLCQVRSASYTGLKGALGASRATLTRVGRDYESNANLGTVTVFDCCGGGLQAVSTQVRHN